LIREIFGSVLLAVTEWERNLSFLIVVSFSDLIALIFSIRLRATSYFDLISIEALGDSFIDRLRSYVFGSGVYLANLGFGIRL
jgi:hypothetical protein